MFLSFVSVIIFSEEKNNKPYVSYKKKKNDHLVFQCMEKPQSTQSISFPFLNSHDVFNYISLKVML